MQVGELVQHGVVLVLDRHHGQMPFGHTVLLHVQASEHSRVGRQGDPVYVLGQWMCEGGDEVGRLEVVDLPHAFGTADQHHVVQT